VTSFGSLASTTSGAATSRSLDPFSASMPLVTGFGSLASTTSGAATISSIPDAIVEAFEGHRDELAVVPAVSSRSAPAIEAVAASSSSPAAEERRSSSRGRDATSAELLTKTPLRLDARVWRPIGSVFQMEVLAVAEEVACALREEFKANAAARWRRPAEGQGQGGECALAVMIEQENFFSLRGQVVQAVQDGIFQRTNRTRGVCLLGFRSAPYIPEPQGFSVLLATVATKRKECRRIYREGYCHAGHNCSWEHPACTVKLDVTISLGSSSDFLWFDTPQPRDPKL